MSRNFRRDSFFIASMIATLFVSATFTGCAKDGFEDPFGSQLDSPSMAAARQEILQQSPRPTIQQTSFEAQIPDPKWHDSLNSAIAEAKMTNKLILADFTGSDWCHFCVKLDDEIFSKPEFKAWANDNVVLLKIDFPKRTQLPPQIRKQNEMLKSRYQISAYPTVLLMDVEGNVRAKMAYERGKSASQWVQIAEARLQHNASRTQSIATRPNVPNLR